MFVYVYQSHTDSMLKSIDMYMYVQCSYVNIGVDVQYLIIEL